MAYKHRKDTSLFAMAEEVRSKTRDPRLRLKLRAILSCQRHSLRDVAEIIGVSRQTLWRWIKRFREEGPEGLQDRPRGHRKPKLSPIQFEQIASWIEKGRDPNGFPISWTLAKLRDEIEKHFGVRMGITPIWRWMRKNGFHSVKPQANRKKRDGGRQPPKAIKKQNVLLLLLTIASILITYQGF
ncbi:MAG: helix-turn-helix domain-containing protein [Candidatus Caldarchaeum sp.]